MTATIESGATNPAADAVEAEWKGLRADASQFADSAVNRGRGLVDAARLQAVDYAEKRKGAAAQSVSDLAGSVRESGRSFEAQPNIRAFFDSAAEGLDQLSGTIRERSLDELYREVEGVMRRRPAAVAAATFATGFLIARFVKASAANAARRAPYDTPADVYDAPVRPQV
jgi:hypothetical protein